MRILITSLLLIFNYSIVPGQIPCSGALNITVKGSSTGKPLIVDSENYDIFCQNMDEGAIELYVDGGSPEYVCVWNTGEEGDNIYNLSPGVYTVTVTDENDCKEDLEFVIEEVSPEFDDLELISYNDCGSCELEDGNSTYIFTTEEYMAYVTDIEDGQNLGIVNICTEFHLNTLYFDGNPVLRRSWCLESETSAAKVRLYFTREELEILTTDSGLDELNTKNLFVRVSSLSSAEVSNSPNSNEDDIIEDINFHPFSGAENVWYIEFDKDLYAGEKYCFYLEYIKDESETFIHETRKIVEAATYTVNNPTIDFVRLDIDGLSLLVNANLYIEDEVKNVVYRKTYQNKLLTHEEFDVSFYGAGIYYLIVEFPKPQVTKVLKFIKITP